MTGSVRYLRIAFCVVVIAGLIIVPMNFNRYGLFILSQWAVMTIAAMGLNLTLGYAGQVSLAQGAFVAIGRRAKGKLLAKDEGQILTLAHRGGIVHERRVANLSQVAAQLIR